MRDRLMIPVAAAVTAMWLAAGFVALATNRVAVFALAQVPFGFMTGWLFREIRRNGNGNGHR